MGFAHVIIKAACLLSILAAQDPPTPAPAPGAHDLVTGIESLPRGTLAVLSISRLDQRLHELQQTTLFRLLADLPWPADAGSTLSDLRRDLATGSGLTDDQLARLFDRGLSIALTGVDETGMPGVLVTVPLGEDADAFTVAARRLQQDGKIGGTALHVDMWNEVPLLSVRRPNGATAAFCISSGKLFASYRTQDLEACLTRLRDRDSSLADNPVFQEFATRAAAEPAPLVTAFCQPPDLLDALLPLMPPERGTQVRAVLEELSLNTMSSIGFVAHARDGRLHDVLRVTFPQPRQGLLAALLGPGLPIRPEAARLIPAGASGFGVSHVQLDRVFEEAIALARVFDPNAPRMVTSSLASLRSRTGVDVEQDLLALLGNQLVSLNWASDDPTRNHMAFLLEVHDAWRVEQAATRLLRNLHLPLTDRVVGGQKVYALGLPSAALTVEPGLAFTGTHMILSTSEHAMDQTLAQLASAEPGPRAQSFLGSLPTGTTAAAWSDFNVVANGMLQQIEKALPAETSLEIFETLRRRLGEVAGALETSLSMDERGITLRSSSPIGNLYMLGASSVVAAIAIPNLLKAREATRDSIARPDPVAPAPRPKTTPVASSQRPTTDKQRHEAIVAAEAERAERVPVVVIEGLESTNVDILRRAAHAAGVLRAVEGVPRLCKLTEHEDAEVRLQAMAALSNIGDSRSLQAAKAALDSENAEMRRFAIATLGRLRDAAATDALVLHLDSEGVAEDEQLQASLALNDIGDPSALLRAATVIDADGTPVDQALAFMFQTLSPKLANNEEAKVLMAVLDHPSRLVRRYAIQRLGQLRLPTTATALEGRLGKETDSLRPLILVSLDAIRGDKAKGADTLDRVRDGALAAWSKTKDLARRAGQKWGTLSQQQQLIAGGSALGVFGLLFLVVALRRRSRRRDANIQRLSSRGAGAAWREPAAYGQRDDAGHDVDEVPWVEEQGDYAEAEEDDPAYSRR